MGRFVVHQINISIQKGRRPTFCELFDFKVFVSVFMTYKKHIYMKIITKQLFVLFYV